jgi:hypothetical protein
MTVRKTKIMLTISTVVCVLLFILGGYGIYIHGADLPVDIMLVLPAITLKLWACHLLIEVNTESEQIQNSCPQASKVE